jgi:diguanylate cyclase (GGDEF)-like protein
MELSLSRARRRAASCAVLYLDLDNFKLVNDSLGHDAGDELLRQLAGRLRVTVRESDLVSRVGGDEFLIMLADLDGTPEDARPESRNSALLAAEGLARRIQDSLRVPFVLEGDEVYVSASIGVSVFPIDAEDGSSLLKNADVAMYRSKRERPGGCMIFAEEARQKLPDLSFATRLRKAVEAKQWVLHYQPIVDLRNGRTVAVESLVRWQDPEAGLIYPNDFIPLAEELGLIGTIGEWVLEEAARQRRVWRNEDDLSIDFTFNLSPRQLWEPDLVDGMMSRLRAEGIEPSSVVVEITESAAMTDLSRSQPILWELHRNGFRLAIDDFGTGYSSLSRLRNLPVDILKIDRFFVGDLPGDKDSRSMVEAIIRMADGLGMKPLAEGIETEAQWKFLADSGCFLGQGYFFSRPRPADDVRAFLAQGHAFASRR